MIAIVTDSSAYFTKDEAVKLGITVVPIQYTVNGQSYMESYSDKNGDFETILKGKATTSQPKAGAFLSCFEEEITKKNQVLCITISSRLSGTYSAAYMAAKRVESDDIVVFDSHLTAGGLYLLIIEAKKLIDKGLSLGEIIKQLPAIRDRITIAFTVDDLSPLRKSGRLNYVRMSVSTILNIKPILLCKDGVVVFDSLAHGSIDIIKKLTAKVTGNVTDIVVNYLQNQSIAANLYNILCSKYPDVNIKLRKLGPILGIHLGLQVAAVSFLSKEELSTG